MRQRKVTNCDLTREFLMSQFATSNFKEHIQCLPQLLDNLKSQIVTSKPETLINNRTQCVKTVRVCAGVWGPGPGWA